MESIVRFGIDSTLRLELADGALLAHCGEPAAKTVEDPQTLVRRALAAPIDYPTLAQATTPGDRVVVVLDEDVPQAGVLTSGVLRELLAAGVAPDGLTLLRTMAEVRAGIGEPTGLDEEVRQRITLAVHDAADRRSMAYLAASKAGRPILLNRAITDADVVLPLGCVHRRWLAGYHGVHSPVFPTFSDQETQARFRSTDTHRPGQARKDLLREVNDVGWLLGVTFTVQLVPGPGDSVLQVLAGEVGAVRRRSQELYEQVWQCRVPGRASLVVAAIEGGPDQQTWQNVGRALAVASRLVEDGGAIALCSDLAEEPGPAVHSLAEARAQGNALRLIRHQHLADALPAAELARTLSRAKVYLLSRLEESVVEELEIAPVAEPAEVARLAQRSRSCIIVSNAPYAVVSANGD